MPHNHKNLSGAALKNPKNPVYMAGRTSGIKLFPRWKQKRKEREAKRRLHTPRKLLDGTAFQLLPNAADLEAMKPTLFERLGSLFSNLRKRAKRESAKGK